MTMTKLMQRKLGRTGRQVTTLGLGGQASLQWTGEGIDPVAIIKKAVGLGINYLDTSNVYGPSQQNFGKAFSQLGLVPGVADYDAALRKKLFLATKTHFRSARQPKGEYFRTNFSEGMAAPFNVKSAVDDVRRSLSLMFGDGKGGYPQDAYLDSIQFHNLNTFDEVDMIFAGFDDPSPERPRMGALAAMCDLRDGTNRTGLNPDKEKLVRHIGISGHWSTATHIYAIQRDTKRVLDTLLVTINPSDGKYLGHRHNALEAAVAAGMGVIAMKVFADAAYYHKESKFSDGPDDVYLKVGSEELPSADLIRYALSISGISTVITGIGHIDDDDEKCQLTQNLQAAQLEKPLDDETMSAIEARVAAAGKHGANAYFQRPGIGLTAPRNLGAEIDTAMPPMGYNGVRISWDRAYAGSRSIVTYEVMRDGEKLGQVDHNPQHTGQRFTFDEILDAADKAGDHRYQVVTVDADGNRAESGDIRPC